MKKISLVQTRDGVNHESEKAAAKYIDNKIGNLLTCMAHQLIHKTKYLDILGYIEDQKETYREILLWEDDKKIDDEEEYYEEV